jgi:sugar lactone lactonase YvrE
VKKISPDGTITTAAGAGYLFSECPTVNPNLPNTALRCPTGVAVDSQGNLYIADTGHNQVQKAPPHGELAVIAGDGTVRSFSGDGGPASGARLDHPYGVTVDATGNLYIADTFNSRIRKVSSGGIISTIAGDGSPIPRPGSGGFSDPVGDSGPALNAKIRQPTGLAGDAFGNVYIADLWEERIRKVSAAGIITTVAGGGSEAPGASGLPATSVRLAGPWAVAVDRDASFYISDASGTAHYSDGRTVYYGGLLKVSPDGILTRVDANSPRFVAVALDAAGNVYYTDFANSGVRKVAPDGTVSTVPGSEGSSAVGLAVDAAGALYIADARNNRVLKVSPDGTAATIAGNGVAGYSGDGGPATNASLSPTAVAVDAAGRVYIADTSNSVIRLLQPVGTRSAQ